MFKVLDLYDVTEGGISHLSDHLRYTNLLFMWDSQSEDMRGCIT